MSADRLELEQDAVFQRREWRIQRIGWVAWAGIMVAALAGLLGPGPYSSREAASSDRRLAIKYNRFVHHHHPTPLEMTLRPESEADDQLRLRLSQPLLDRIQVQRIEPEPVSSELTTDGAWYVFRLQPGAASAKVHFHVEFERMGAGAGELQLAGSEPVAIQYFVYP